MLEKLFHMGGYAAYVWPAYIIVIMALFINAWQTAYRLHVVLKQDDEKNAETTTTNNYSY